MASTKKYAYFSMEIGLESSLATYSGGLGVLAGDTIRSAADLELPMVAVTLLYHQGYFKQELTEDGVQVEKPVSWDINKLQQLPGETSVEIEGRRVKLTAWKYAAVGVTGHEVPVVFLDAHHPENEEWDRTLTDRLYGGDERYRLAQEVILGEGGVKMLRALGHTEIERFHMNEGHAALLTLPLLEELKSPQALQERCVFTTHTPVPAGHDRFTPELAVQVLGEEKWGVLSKACKNTEELNMTEVALNFSNYVNGVAMKHGEVSREMFPGFPIRSITNGVHLGSWTSEPFAELFDKHLEGWRKDNFQLRHALGIPNDEVWDAHYQSKRLLLDRVKSDTGLSLDPDVLTVGFARRATGYKRADLVFSSPERLNEMVRQQGPLQFIFAGKAHPKDEQGKQLIQNIFEAKEKLGDGIKLVYLENYNMELGRLITSGVDVWLNNPIPPREASGTSGMKAALNGVPNLSVLDGWWIEGHAENVTGWAFSDEGSLYQKLETQVIPTYYERRSEFVAMMKNSISFNASYFNTERMVWQYWQNAYKR